MNPILLIGDGRNTVLKVPSIDVPRIVLRRLAKAWQENSEYRDNMISTHVTQSSNTGSFAEKPKISVNIKDSNGQLMKCSVDTNDQTATSESYSCEPTTNTESMSLTADYFYKRYTVIILLIILLFQVLL